LAADQTPKRLLKKKDRPGALTGSQFEGTGAEAQEKNRPNHGPTWLLEWFRAAVRLDSALDFQYFQDHQI
jgi:hypothetical protein